MTQYDEKMVLLQKKVQLNPLDLASWQDMLSLCDEAIAAQVDVPRWQKVRKTLVIQADLMSHAAQGGRDHE